MDHFCIALTLLANADTVDASGLPWWAKYLLGPLGTLVLLIIYAIRTEKVRIPKLIELLEAEQKENDDLRDKVATVEKATRVEMQVHVANLTTRLRRCRDKYTKERSTRTWWQAKAEAAYDRLGEKSGIPKDIDKTSYGSLDEDESKVGDDNDKGF